MAVDEDPFALIQKGNGFKAASDYWRAAEHYGRAVVQLLARADDLAAQPRSASADERGKVMSLYRAQSLEYTFKARHCLVNALRRENEQDRANYAMVVEAGTGSLDPLCLLIDRDEARRRQLTFERLFAGGGAAVESDVEVTGVGKEDALSGSAFKARLDKFDDKRVETKGNASDPPSAAATPKSSQLNSGGSGVENDDAKIEHRRQSIESRLAGLDTACLPKVPPPFVVGSRGGRGGDDQQRLDDIRRGLGRLGVSLPDHKKSDLIPDNVSEEDQVKLILQQAHDEVRVETGRNVDEDGSMNDAAVASHLEDGAIDENDSMFEGFDEEDEEDIDALLEKAETLVAKTRLASNGDGGHAIELGQIRKAQALLLEARLCLEMEQDAFPDEGMEPEDLEDAESKVAKQDDAALDDASESSTAERRIAHGAVATKRKKAQQLVQQAQGCLENVLHEWK